MTLQQLLQNSEYKQKFVLEKLIQEYLWYSREEMRLNLDQEIPHEVVERIEQGYHEYVVNKKPLEYILGHVDFFGVPFYVNEHTLIPRPETEYMITAVSEHLEGVNGTVRLLDIGTGCGVLGISVLLQNPDFFKEVYFSDISPEALEVAKRNYKSLIEEGKGFSTQAHFLQANLADFMQQSYTPWQGGRPTNNKLILEGGGVIVANLPYIPDETFDTNALENVQKWEPRLAFVGGKDGLDLYREMFQQIKGFQLSALGFQLVMFLEMMTWQVEILKAEFGDWLEFEEVKTFHFNIRIVKARRKDDPSIKNSLKSKS